MRNALPAQAPDGGLRFEATRASYESLTGVAAAIRELVAPHLNKMQAAPQYLVLLDHAPAAALDAVVGFRIQMNNLRAVFVTCQQIAQGGLEILGEETSWKAHVDAYRMATRENFVPGSGAVAAALNLFALLRKDVTYSGRDVVLDSGALGLHLARQWQDAGEVQVQLPTLCPPSLDSAGDEVYRKLLECYAETALQREGAFRKIHALVQGLPRLKSEDPRIGAVKYALDYAKDQFESADQIFTNFTNRVSAQDEKTGSSFLELIRTGALIEKAHGREDTLFLFARVLAAGGTYRTIRSFLRSIFSGDGLRCTGGTVVGYALLTPTGKILESGTIAGESTWDAEAV
jgi:hypothetical protein